MNEHVNLLDNTTGRDYKGIITRLRLIRGIAVTVLFFTAAFSVMLFLVIAFSPLPRLRQEEKRYIDALNAGENRQKLDKYYFIESRLKDIDTLLTKRPEIVDNYAIVEKIFTPSMLVNFVDITEAGTTFSVSSPTLSDVEKAVDILRDEAKNNPRIAAMILSGISYNAKDNAYEMSVTITEN